MKKIILFILIGNLNAGISPERQKELIDLLQQDCGACHGLNLKGGLGPALQKKRMQALGLAAIKQTILDGRPNTPMPPWRPFLSEEDAQWLANYIIHRP